MQEAITAAVLAAREEYENADKSPIDHGYAHVQGVDGRTRLASALKEHPDIDVRTGGYHGTTLTVSGVTRYASAQRKAYRAFIDELENQGIEQAEDLSIFVNRN